MNLSRLEKVSLVTVSAVLRIDPEREFSPYLGILLSLWEREHNRISKQLASYASLVTSVPPECKDDYTRDICLENFD